MKAKRKQVSSLLILRGRNVFVAHHRDLDQWAHLVGFSSASTIMNLRDLKRVHAWLGKVIEAEKVKGGGV